MLYPVLVGKVVTFPAAAAAGRYFYWYRCPLAVISDSGGYFEISLSVSPGHVAKIPVILELNLAMAKFSFTVLM